MGRDRPTVSARTTASARPRAIVSRLVEIALFAVIALGLASVVMGRLLPLLGHPVYIVAGPSMEPAIRVGSAAILEIVPPDALAVGDVVSLRSGPDRAVFTHRIIRIAEQDGQTWIETKGDANETVDPSVTSATAVIGRVMVSLPYAGYLVSLLSTAPGVILIVSTGALLLVLGWLLDAQAAGHRRRGPVASSRTVGAVRATRGSA